MKFALSIETQDRRLGFDITGSAEFPSAGSGVQVPGGATINFDGLRIRKGLGIPEVLQFTVDAPENIDLALFAMWLYDKVKGKSVERIFVERRVITEITQDHIRQVLHEVINSDK